MTTLHIHLTDEFTTKYLRHKQQKFHNNIAFFFIARGLPIKHSVSQKPLQDRIISLIEITN